MKDKMRIVTAEGRGEGKEGGDRGREKMRGQGMEGEDGWGEAVMI